MPEMNENRNKPNIFVISHRRSGTHLTIDSVTNNFMAYGTYPYVTLDYVNKHVKNPIHYSDVEHELEEHPRIIKTHFLSNFNQYVRDEQIKKKLDALFAGSKKIYVYRNGKDTLVSLYEYMKSFRPEIKGMNFSEFIKMRNDYDPEPDVDRVEFWKYHIQSWMNSNYQDQIFFLKFEDLVNDYKTTMQKISEFIECPMNTTVKDIRLRNKNNRKWLVRVADKLVNQLKGIQRSSVYLRKGKVGDSASYFDTDTEQYFNDRAGDMMQKLGY
jgi:hypothetical protein